jgi:hypothetical protein
MSTTIFTSPEKSYLLKPKKCPFLIPSIYPPKLVLNPLCKNNNKKQTKNHFVNKNEEDILFSDKLSLSTQSSEDDFENNIPNKPLSILESLAIIKSQNIFDSFNNI